MSPALRRGSVVVRGRKYGVVWAVRDHHVELIPILVPHQGWAHDVELGEEERLLANIPLRGAVVRASVRVLVPVDGQQLVGDLGGMVCRVMQAVVRAAIDTKVRARWACDRDHRREAAVAGVQGGRGGHRVMRAG